MKQKLKEKFNVADKVKKTSFTKCVKMSKEVENLKNGVLNGDSVITNNHNQEQHLKLNNSNVDTTTKTIVGGRLQFYKDGKFILELARAREGEKTGWISVPRKTFWPPTISTNSSTTFTKHESSTSLSYSDDNSSVQSSPWQRDHCLKQSRPRQNISKEMSFFYNRPNRLYLIDECRKVSQIMRRKPLYKCNNGTVKFNGRPRDNKKEGDGDSEVTSTSDSKIIKEENDGIKESSSSGSSSPNDSKESVDTLDNDSKRSAETKRTDQNKLDKILKKLADKISSRFSLNANSANGHQNIISNTVPNNYSLTSHIINSINSSQYHQHVSPRKRILRELEKVSLEDTKRSRSKSINSLLSEKKVNINTFSNGSVNISKTTEKAQPTVSRPISSYSITSLLAHNTSNCNSKNTRSVLSSCNDNIKNYNDSINTNDSFPTSPYLQEQQQRINSSIPSPPPQTKSPHLMSGNNIQLKSPNSAQSIGSPSQSPPSPEHHAFHKYRSNSNATTSTVASSPYNNSYHSPNYMRGSPSPHDRLRTSGNFQHSPNSHYGTSSPQHNYITGSTHRDSSLSPNLERPSSNHRNTPTSIQSHSSGIRNVPKKTTALRQQFSSPTLENNNNKKTLTSTNNLNNEKPIEVDGLIRPSILIPPPIPTLGHHPAAPLSHYPYMYQPINYLPQAVPPYYPSFYNPAMLAAAAAAYRFPISGYPSQTTTPLSSLSSTPISTSSSPIMKNDKIANGHHRSSSSLSPEENHHPHSYMTASPWNQITLTNHHDPINDGNNLISKTKVEQQTSDVPLNLSKH